MEYVLIAYVGDMRAIYFQFCHFRHFRHFRFIFVSFSSFSPSLQYFL